MGSGFGGGISLLWKETVNFLRAQKRQCSRQIIAMFKCLVNTQKYESLDNTGNLETPLLICSMLHTITSLDMDKVLCQARR